MMIRPPHTGEIVLRYAYVVGVFRVAVMAKDLGLERTQAHDMALRLAKAKQLSRIDEGLYAYTAPVLPLEQTIREKMWAACRINPTFTLTDIARQAGTSKAYGHKIFKAFRDQGYIVRVGSRKPLSGTGSVEHVHRMTEAARRMPKPATPESMIPTIKDAYTLLRLIAGGVLEMQPERIEEALKMIRRITHDLKRMKELRDAGTDCQTTEGDNE